MESQLEFLDETMKYITKFQQELPGVMTAHAAFSDEVYRDGALSGKVKRLIALAVAFRAGCTACILGQTKCAVEAGATKAEVSEAVAVAIAMSGTTAQALSGRVVKVMEELGK